ncbi:hypothetical protein CBR_g54094 [Chara braunii]|uniref:peptide-methionine (S)-S-oxide reductase n=1 Tax=Chara braunii TaxID=69332 RepID=A0A388MC15_CHABU|nr:hypothetical protein CBR_g54094 [Chara braunii]|eukprot:GBG91999.1 hypothetical protein CBR_g54094 [Chara braunii]
MCSVSGSAVLRTAACATAALSARAQGGRSCRACMCALPSASPATSGGSAGSRLRIDSQHAATARTSSVSSNGDGRDARIATPQGGGELSCARGLAGRRERAGGVFSPNGATSSASPSRSISQGVVAMASGGWRSFLSGLGGKSGSGAGSAASSGVQPQQQASRALEPDDTVPAPGCELISFGAGCFWGVELAFQRVPGVTKTAVGYAQGLIDTPSYGDVCSGNTGHAEVVLVEYDPKETSLETLLDVFWSRHDPTQLNRQGNDVGTQYRSGIYFYTPEQEATAKKSLEEVQARIGRKIVTEVLPARKFYAAEEYHQQYLSKGGRFGRKQSAAKGCTDPISCYG